MADSSSSSTPQEEVFEDWLNYRMRQLGLDEDVFGSYVTGVLDSEDTDEDRKDALIGVFEGMTQYPLNDLCNEVIERWKTSRAEVLQEKTLEKEQKAAEKQNKLAEIMEKQASTVSSTKPTQEKADREIKKLLVAQYGHESDEEFCTTDSDEEQVSCSSADKDSGIFKNVNAQSVADKEKEKRDKMKEETEQRKQQIKEAKEKQKQKLEERKEKEKKRTQKGERRAR